MNGYFQLEYKPEGTYMHIFNATDGGAPVAVQEVAEYLQKKSINIDITVLNRQILAITDAKGFFKLDDMKRYPEREQMIIKLSPDKMTAFARFYPPSVGGIEFNRDSIVSELHEAKVLYGIDMDAIDAFLAHKVYCTDIPLAKGKPVRHGSDASIEYFFNTDLRARPTVKEDGSVDFFNLNTMNHVKEGDLLAKLQREDLGDNGITVTNEIVKPKDVKKLILKYGRNIRVSENGLEAFSEINGHVVLVEDKIFVSDIYQVQNVDNSTGDINYDGSVQITGNVCSNFTVRAKGNIEVMGVVEGATLEAGGNITIARGVNGMGKGNLKAGGNIIAKFIENASAVAEGYVEAGAILHSRVMAKTDVHVSGKRAMISGAHVSATNLVETKILGSQMGADTIIEVGIDPSVKIRHQDLMKEVDQIKKNLKQIEPVLVAMQQKMKQGQKLSPDKMKYVQSMATTYQQLSQRLKSDLTEYEELEAIMSSDTSGVVKVTDVVYAGTKIVMSDLSLIVKDDCKFCKFYRAQGDIKRTSL
ncbi:MAG: DUF342 domain-containing protein [Lachnospiraceae bacterium]|nr:DUF342 domain-containing protein [Lachnospiraceae bacterium]